MDININGIKNHLQTIYQFGVVEGGKLKDHTVWAFNKALEIVRKDGRVAAATFVVANILIFEIALRVTSLVDKLIVYLFGPQENWGQKATYANSFFVLTLLSSLIVGANVALYKSLKTPLTPLVTAAISTATVASYLLFRCATVNMNGSTGTDLPVDA